MALWKARRRRLGCTGKVKLLSKFCAMFLAVLVCGRRGDSDGMQGISEQRPEMKVSTAAKAIDVRDFPAFV